MLVVIGEKQQVIAEITADVGSLFASRTLAYGDFSRIMAVIRHIPRDILAVNVRYPLVSDQSFPFTIHGATMNLDMYMPDRNESASKPDRSDFKTYYFVPAPAETPNDGFLTYATVESVADLVSLPERTVVMLRPDQLVVLNMLRDYSSVFKIDAKVLSGVPGSDYSASFDEAAWAFDKVAYVPFITELSEVSNLTEQLKLEQRTPYALEKEQYTRKDGSVRSMQAFAGPDEDISDEPDDEEMKL